jgi:predicted nucleic acid-binding protein
VFIADEQRRRRATERLPDEAAISVMRLAELEPGVHVASSEVSRAGRLKTLRAAQATYVALPIDEHVTSAFAEIVACARRSGRHPKVQDAWIAATAHAHDVAISTQDDDCGLFPSTSFGCDRR